MVEGLRAERGRILLSPHYRAPRSGRRVSLLHDTSKPLTKQQSELGHGSRPLGRSTFPGGREIHDGQIDQLLGSLFIGEQSARLDYLPDSSVEPFNRIDRIDLRTDLRRELEERDHLCPGPFPDLDDGRVLFAHGRIPKTLQSTFCSVGIHCLIDGLELLAHGRSVLLRNE